MVFYGDLFYLLQFLWNYGLFFFSARMISIHLDLWQYLAMSTLVSLIPLGMLYFISVPKILWTLIEIILLLVISKSVTFCISNLLINMLAGGIYLLYPNFAWSFTLLFLAIYLIFLKYSQNKDIYTVICKKGEKKIRLKALYDTGNRLFLEGEKTGVCLVEYESIKKLMEWETISNPKIISYSSVGKQGGYLLAIPLDQLIISEKNIKIKHPYVAITKQTLSNTKEYQMILHKDIFY